MNIALPLRTKSVELHKEPPNMKVTIAAHLPDEVHGVEYMKNSHFIQLTDAEGRQIKVNATGVVMYECSPCKEMFFLFTNQAACCPICSGKKITSMWVRPQLAFIPDGPSDFRGGLIRDDDGEDDESKDG